MSRLWHKVDIVPSWIPFFRECGATYPFSALSQCTYLINKHNHFKRTGGRTTTNNNWNEKGHKTFIGFDKMMIYWPLMDPISGKVRLAIPILVWVRIAIYLIGILISRRKAVENALQIQILTSGGHIDPSWAPYQEMWCTLFPFLFDSGNLPN